MSILNEYLKSNHINEYLIPVPQIPVIEDINMELSKYLGNILILGNEYLK